jgi:deoxyribonuclease V
MIAFLDVQYEADRATVAGVLAHTWTDAAPERTITLEVAEVAPYQSGAFYKRELPCLLALLGTIPDPLEVIVVDGFVYLSAKLRLGLGAHLHAALGGKTPVVGVAKTPFQGAPGVPVLRGKSTRPLFVSSIGCDVKNAAAWVAAMHGAHRMPTLLQAVDHAARGWV